MNSVEAGLRVRSAERGSRKEYGTGLCLLTIRLLDLSEFCLLTIMVARLIYDEEEGRRKKEGRRQKEVEEEEEDEGEEKGEEEEWRRRRRI